mgnify:CR=1 FL=1
MPVLSVRQFAPLMRQRLTVAPFSSYNTYGEPSYGSAVTYQCALIGDMKLIRNAQGQEVPSKQTAYLMSNAAITPEDYVTLSTDDVGSTESFALHPVILAVGRYPFVAGNFASVLYF